MIDTINKTYEKEKTQFAIAFISQIVLMLVRGKSPSPTSFTRRNGKRCGKPLFLSLIFVMRKFDGVEPVVPPLIGQIANRTDSE